jgi:hypothetical protein
MSYGYRRLDQLLDHNFWTDLASLYESGFWHNFTMTSPETLYMKNVSNKLSFLSVTHTTYFDIWFGCYEFLNSDFCTDQVLDRPVIQVLGQVFGPLDE